jgi:AI-2 transport protein TqsA
MAEPRAAAGLPRGILIMVGLAATTIVIGGLRAIADIVGPVFLALTVTIAAMPLRTGLMRRGAPRWVGTIAAILAVYLGVLLMAGSIVVSGARLAQLIPQYQDELNDVLDGVQDLLASFGVSTDQTQNLLSGADLGQLADYATSLLGSVLGLVTNLAFIVTLVLFMSVDSNSFATQLEAVRRHRAGFVEAMERFVKGTRKYFLVSTIFGLIVAVIDTIFLWIIGVPGAALWGLLAFLTNYIPNIGFVLGVIPPALLGLLAGGPGLMLAVIIGYSVINMIIQSVIQPKLVGDAVGMSASLTFLSLVVWAWIIGPLGAILAIPLSLLVKALFVDVDPQTRWASGLMGDTRERVEAEQVPVGELPGQQD